MTHQLLPNETMILTAHRHWIVLVKSLIVPIALLVLVGIADVFLAGKVAIIHFRTFMSLLGLAIAGLWFIVVWVRWRATSYTLTDQRIILESGVFGRQSKIIPIDRIQDCSTRQSVFGRMLGYGRVEVDAAGAQGAEVLDHLPSPGPFRDQVFVQSEKRRGGGQTAPAPNPSGV